MITETPLGPRPSSLRLKLAVAFVLIVIVAAAVVLAIVLLSSSDDAAANRLTISSGDPLAVADFHAGTAPRIGMDHWHASYTIWIGDQRQPNAPTWESGIHTHGDGIMHIHPFQSFEEGSGAALSKWFEYGGGELTTTSMREPGAFPDATVHNGDPVPGDGRSGEVFVFLNGCGSVALEGYWLRVPVNYIPQDGDQLCIMFEPEALMRERIKNPPSLPPRSPSPVPAGAVTPPVTGTAPPP